MTNGFDRIYEIITYLDGTTQETNRPATIE